MKKIALSELQVYTRLGYCRLLDISIENRSNEHGRMSLTVELDESIEIQMVQRLRDTEVEVRLPKSKLFCGICKDIAYEEQSGYKTLCLEVYSYSYLLDVTPVSQTYQSPTKKLGYMMKELTSKYGGGYHIAKDSDIPTVLYQQNETDWAFMRRLANQYQQEVYVDVQNQGVYVSIGAYSRKSYPASMPMKQVGVYKDIGELRLVLGNDDPTAASYQYVTEEYVCAELAIIPGDTIGNDIVVRNVIVNNGGLLENYITLGKLRDVKAKHEDAVAATIVSGVLTGKVLEVIGNNIQVQLDTDVADMAGNCVEVPYESAISNSFYSMPDKDDLVFLYYENNGTIICLGSKRNRTYHPDYEKPEEKSLTSYDKMIRFTSDKVKFTSTRAKHDEEDDTEISIILDDNDGITITSGSDVVIETTEEGSILLAAMADSKALEKSQIDFLKGKSDLAGHYQRGYEKYLNEGGMNKWEQFKKVTGEEVNRDLISLKNNGIDTWNQISFKNLRDAIFRNEDIKPEAEVGEQTEEQIEEAQYNAGCITIYGLNCVIAQVKDSFLILDLDIYINATKFDWLGYTRKTHDIVVEEYQDWWSLALDGLQLVLDFAGFIPGVGAFFDVANAVVSLARGDVCGAAMSLVCAIPGVGDACAVAKVATKVCKTAEKAAELVQTVQKVYKVAKAIYLGVKFLDQGVGLYKQVDDVFDEMKSGEFDFSNPNDLAKCVKIISSCKGMVGTVKDFGENVKTNRNSGGSDADNTQRRNGDDSDTDNIGRRNVDDYDTDPQRTQNQNNDGPENNRDACDTTDDPINVITGSLLAEYVDLGLEDVLESFSLKRFYESVYDNRGGILGNKWRYEIESSVKVTDRLAVLQMPDLHMERFVKESGIWRNERKTDTSLVFSETVDGYQLKLNKTGEIYDYNRNGQLTVMSDIHGNRRTLSYQGSLLHRIILASGQWLEFVYDAGKVVKIKDCLDREVKYTYENNLLTQVILPNGGTMYYEYTKEGFLTAITDLNGKCYSRNFFDRKGRVIRQELAGGEEYVAFYDDANKQNTFLTTSNGENITYTYGKEQLATRILYPDGTDVVRAYDECKNVIYEKDRLGRETVREFNASGMLTREQQPDGFSKYLEYNEKNLPTHVWDNTGREIYNTYDATGNLLENRIRQDDRTEQVTRFTYDNKGRVLTVTNPEGSTERYRYDTDFAEPSKYTTASGAEISYSYDAGGRRMETRDAYGSTEYGYNVIGHCTIKRDAEGNTTRYFYDNMANLIKEIRPNAYDAVTDDGPGREFTFDVWTYISRIIEPDGAVSLYENDFRGNLLREWNPREAYKEGEPGTRYEYDINRNRIRTIYADGTILREKYDVCGNLLKRILPESYDAATDDGPGYTYTYDACNRLTQITNPYGVVEKRYVYDLRGNVIKEISAKGYETGNTDDTRVGTLYTYDCRDNVTSIRVPLVITEDGTVEYRLITYRYNRLNLCVEEKRFLDYQTVDSARGRVNVIHYTYDKAGRLTDITDTTGAHMEYAYNERNQRTMEKQKIAEGIWHERHYEYSASGRIIRVAESADEKGCGRRYVSTRYSYDKSGNVTRIQTPTGNEILREYDLCDRVTAEIHREKNGSISNRTTYSYDEMGNLTQVCNSEDYKTAYSYDRMNRLSEVIDSDGARTISRYDRNGNLVCRINPQEYAQYGTDAKGYCYTYDMLGRNTDIHSPEGNHIRKVAYNKYGETEHEGDGISGVKLAYDFAGRRSLLTTDAGRTQSYSYDALGNITGLVDGNGNHTAYTTDLWGRVTVLSLPDGTKEQYGYDHAGNRTTATDGNGNTVTYQYNCINRMSQRTDASGATEYFAYDMEGRLSEHTDRNGSRTLYRYNMYGSPVLHEAADTGLTESWEYDALGRLKSATAGGMRYEYAYYGNGRLREKKASGRTLLAYAYDLDGNKVSRRDLTGKETAYSYNRNGQMTSVSENGRILAAYTYHADGNVEKLTVGNSLTTQYSYDTDRNLTGLRTVDGENILADNTYDYDANANRIGKHSIEGLTRYSYDANNRLVEVQYPNILGEQPHFEQLSYDKAGNRTGRVTESVSEQYSYDNCNRLTQLQRSYTDLSKSAETVSYSYDKQGNMLSDGKNTYGYDSFNRVEQVTTSDGNIQKNHYDAEGLRHEMEENGALVKFLFNENREVEVEEESNGNIIRYIRGLGIICSDSESAKTYYHYVSDEHGSITHVTDAETGEVLNHYTYDAFGNTMECSEKVHNRFRYNGEQYDPLTSQYYLRARFYNPVIARFTQEDTYYGDGLNLYQYCANNPIAYVDPSGHMCEVLESIYKKNKGDNSDMPASQAYQNAKNLRASLSDGEKSQIRDLYAKAKTDPNAATQLNKLIGDLESQYAKYATAIDDKVTVIEKDTLGAIGDTFTDGQYRTVITNQDIVLYRVYGGSAKKTGGFWTTSRAKSKAETQVASALLPEWGNTMNWETRMVVPKGTKLNIGTVEKQTMSNGTVLSGGADQILLPMNWDTSWIDKGYRRRLK